MRGTYVAFSSAEIAERLTLPKLGAVLLALVGTVLAIGPTGGGRTLGILLGIASAVIYSIYILAGSRIMPRAGSIPSSTIVMIAASIVFGDIVSVQGPAFPVTMLGWAAIAAIALISTVLAIVAFFAGLERIGPSRSSTISTVEPVVSVLLAALVLGESFNALQVVGGSLIVIAAVICSLGDVHLARCNIYFIHPLLNLYPLANTDTV
jgi:drug/metabolite transporter (DMT)-like permease